MQLKTYLEKHSISVAEFARQIGVKSRATVHRYISTNADNKRMPDEVIMQAIAKVTGGAVTANDFYGLNGHKPKKPTVNSKTK